ncbi:MAG TPA: hypothetical protein VL860_09690, partial [Planctomycetota bacterium]|nr:hypothetical protein [Planctomycetota bacterium]
MKPPPPQPPPKPFPWFRTTLVLGGLTAGVIIFSRYHTDLPWCQKVDQISRPAIEKTCDTSAQAWDWAR